MMLKERREGWDCWETRGKLSEGRQQLGKALGKRWTRNIEALLGGHPLEQLPGTNYRTGWQAGGARKEEEEEEEGSRSNETSKAKPNTHLPSAFPLLDVL